MTKDIEADKIEMDVDMNKLEETNLMIKYITDLKGAGLTVDNSIILEDIAKSLAMIANKLCEAEMEE